LEANPAPAQIDRRTASRARPALPVDILEADRELEFVSAVNPAIAVQNFD
jgi:hypothetical protein